MQQFGNDGKHVIASSMSEDVTSSPAIHPSPTLLARAISQNNGELCIKIIDSGISINVDLPGCTSCPLRSIFRAIECGHSNLVELFLRKGANLEDSACLEHPLGLQNILLLAIFHGSNRRVLQILLDALLTQGSHVLDAALNPFHVAALTNNAEALDCVQKHIQEKFHAYWYVRIRMKLPLNGAFRISWGKAMSHCFTKLTTGTHVGHLINMFLGSG